MTITNQVMKRLIVDELQTALTQSLVVASPTVVERILPHLYIQGTPTGTIVLRIKLGSTIVSEQTQSLATIIAGTGKTMANYHGYVSFQFPKPPILNAGTYTLELAVGTYVYASSVFVGWVKRPSASAHLSVLNFPHDLYLVELRTS